MIFIDIAIGVLAFLAIFIFVGTKLLRVHIVKKANIIKPLELSGLLDSGNEVLIIDIRTRRSFNGLLGHIDGAVNMPYSDVDNILKGKDLSCFYDVKIVIMDETDTFAGLAIYNKLKSCGFNDVSLLFGGLALWIKNKLPIIRGEKE